MCDVPVLTSWADDARRSYSAYGVDLIRTGCLLLRTTPSVTYRASVLFQRFQAVAENVRAKRGDYESEKSNDSSYLVPVRTGCEYPSGIIMLGDLFAPLDYSIFYLKEHDDVTYLAAACVLIATKIEDPSTRIRLIVGVFMRLNQRRRGEPVIELLQPPPERYDDFKLCVLDAEEVVLHALGFQTFVECPIKYAILFAGILVEDCNEKEMTGDVATGTEPRLGLGNSCLSHPLMKEWLANAVCWLNDIPRSLELYARPAHELALCALWDTCPATIGGLPDNWTLAFGVGKPQLTSILRVHQKHLAEAAHTESYNLQLIMTTRPKPSYPREVVEAQKPILLSVVVGSPTGVTNTTTAKPTVVGATAAAAAAITVGAKTAPIPSPVESPPPGLRPPAPLVDPKVTSQQMTLSLPPAVIPAPFHPMDVWQSVLHPTTGASTEAMETQKREALSSLQPPPVEELHFEDLRELQRKRRQREEREAEERRSKRRRSSSSRRHRRHSSGRRRRRSSSRHRDDSRARRKRRYSPTASGSKAHQGNSGGGGGGKGGDRHRNDERQRRDDRHRNDDQRHRKDDRQRNDSKSQHKRHRR